jgi:hypothetical protein
MAARANPSDQVTDSFEDIRPPARKKAKPTAIRSRPVRFRGRRARAMSPAKTYDQPVSPTSRASRSGTEELSVIAADTTASVLATTAAGRTTRVSRFTLTPAVGTEPGPRALPWG